MRVPSGSSMGSSCGRRRSKTGVESCARTRFTAGLAWSCLAFRSLGGESSHNGEQLVCAERLAQRGVRADLARHRKIILTAQATAARHGHDASVRKLALDAVDRLDAIHVRHEDVGDHDVRSALLLALQRLAAVRCYVDVKPGTLQAEGDEFANVGLVVDHEDTHVRTQVVRRSAASDMARTNAYGSHGLAMKLS